MSDVSFAPLPLAIVFSGDDFLRESVALALRERAYVVPTGSPVRLRALLHEGSGGAPGAGDPVLLFYDLRLAESLETFAEITGSARSRICTVAVGRPGSAPFTAAEEARVYRCVDHRTLTDARAVATVADAALERINLQQENLLLRAELARARVGSVDPLLGGGSSAAGAGAAPEAATPLALRQIVRPTRLGEGGKAALFENVVAGVASVLCASRAGLYHRQRSDEPFRLAKGQQVIDPTLEFGPEDPLARWLDRFRQPVTRRAADALGDGAGRMLLRRALDLLGAEFLIPLVVRGTLAGWVFAGAGFGGGPGDFHSLQAVAEHASTALENHANFEATTLQKTLVESVLGNLPAAIVAVESDGAIRWANARAEALFPVLADRHGTGRTRPIIEDVSGRLAGLVRAALAGDPPEEVLTWEHNLTARTYSARVHAPRAAGERGEILGVFTVIEDVTAELAERTRQEVAIRQTLCADLAAGLAHEIRNPLVALKTFSQLLPQRHQDEEFREEFGSLIERDVGRLDGLLENLDRFARKPKPGERRAVHIVELLRAAEDTTKKLLPAADPRVKIIAAGRQLGLPGAPGVLAQANVAQLPLLSVDPPAILRALTALFVNGVEAAARKGVIPVLTVDVIHYGADRFSPARSGPAPSLPPSARTEDPDRGLRLSIADNGLGIEPDLLPRVFSPFYTTKAQGLGLGLPTAQGIILDHGGRLELDSGSRGLCVHLVLPLR